MFGLSLCVWYCCEPKPFFGRWRLGQATVPPLTNPGKPGPLVASTYSFQFIPEECKKVWKVSFAFIHVAQCYDTLFCFTLPSNVNCEVEGVGGSRLLFVAKVFPWNGLCNRQAMLIVMLFSIAKQHWRAAGRWKMVLLAAPLTNSFFTRLPIRFRDGWGEGIAGVLVLRTDTLPQKTLAMNYFHTVRLIPCRNELNKYSLGIVLQTQILWPF